MTASSVQALTGASKEKPVDDIARFLKEKSSFTEEQINTLICRLREAEAENLPVSHLSNRIKEGVAKKREFSDILQVLDRKIAQFREARNLVEKFARKGMIIKEKQYSIHVLGELLEMGYPEDDFINLANIAILRKIKCEDILGMAKLQMELQRKEFPFSETREIITAAILKKMKPPSIKSILRLLRDAKIRGLDIEKVRKIVIEGIEKNNIQWIKNNINTLGSK